MRRRNGCLKALGGFVALVLVLCVIGYLVVLPRVQDAASDGVADMVSTYAADEFSGRIRDGEVRISLSELSVRAADEERNVTIEGLNVTSENDRIVVSFDVARSDTVSFSARPQVNAEGQLGFVDVEASDGFLATVLSPDKIADGIAQGVNRWVNANGFLLADARVDGDSLVLVTEPKP